MDEIFADNFNEANREYLIENDERDCNHFEQHDPIDGVCRKHGDQKHGYDDACGDFEGVTL